ncbi:MAG: hypothetical protein JST27_09935 [Bacteroidetes bacterium]|nr:hypothetical protein [Bacteroidota bacterium]
MEKQQPEKSVPLSAESQQQNIENKGSEQAIPAPNTHKGGIHNNALYAAGMGRAATAQVNPHRTDDLANTGTNVWYEGATAPGSGGSSGTGYTSGQAGTGASISSPSDFDELDLSKHPEAKPGTETEEQTDNASEKP